MPKISLDNLERYDGHLKDWCDARFASKSVNENWSETEEAGVVQFYPVPDTEIHPVVKFSFKETLPASGDKSPTNPSTINGVSSVNVGHNGKNLLLQASGRPSSYTVVRNADGSLSISGSRAAIFQVTDGGASTSGPYSSYILNLNSQYTLSVEVVSGSITDGTINIAQSVATQRSVSIPASGKASITFTPSAVGYVDGRFVCRLLTGSSSVATNAVLKIQLEEGDAATDFEAPMLPADANHDTPLGNTYYGGEVDLATGIMTVTWEGMVLTGEETITEESQSTSTGAYQYSIKPGLRYAKQGYNVCTHFLHGTGTDGTGHFYVRYTGGTGVRFFTDISTVQGFADFLAAQYTNGTPVVFTYKLATPYTVQLSPLQIKSLTQSNLYTPRLNTVYTDADTVKVRYQKSPIVTSSDIDNAILSLGGD